MLLLLFTSAWCWRFSPPLKSSWTRLPKSGQLVGPGRASRLCGHRAVGTASLASSTQTEDVGLKCCSPTDFFFSTSMICGAFWICVLIFSKTPSFGKKLCVIWREVSGECVNVPSQMSLSLKWGYTLPQYIPMAAYIPSEHGTNQKSVLHDVEVEPTIHFWVHVVSISTPLIPGKCPRPLPA